MSRPPAAELPRAGVNSPLAVIGKVSESGHEQRFSLFGHGQEPCGEGALADRRSQATLESPRWPARTGNGNL